MSYQLTPEAHLPPAYTTEADTDPEQRSPLIQRYRALLSMVELFARQHSLPELLVESGKRLRDVINFDLLSLALHDAIGNVMCHTLIHGDNEPKSQEVPVDTSASGWTWENQHPIVISELTEEQRYPDTLKLLCEKGMNSACILPMTVPTRRLGAIVLASAMPSAYAQVDLTFLQQAAGLIAMSIDNTLSHQSLSQDKNRLELLLEISRSLSSSLHFEKTFPQISEALHRVMAIEYTSISVPDKQGQGMNLLMIHPLLDDKAESILASNADSIAAPAMTERVTKCYDRAALERSGSPLARRLLDQAIQYVCCFPLITSRGALGTFNVAGKNGPVCDAEKDLMMQVSNYIAIALENASAYQEIAAFKARLAEEKLYLEDEIRTELNFEEIIGENAQLKRALADARTVAPSEANVLILGETGTGKELIARAIHKMSGRKDNSFIKLNCSAIPTGLLESELFGHEKGAFTGAISQKVGRMELANGGTLFLDEVGDIPLELQPKLLRVLQDQEFERLGSNKTIRVNVRLIAATNRDLAALVAAREFRSDLYYRLKVFPIQLPPLRDRRQDIPLLVRYFVQRLSRRMNKVIDSIPATTMDTLTSWDWPGNIRELENFMERSVILSKGPALTIPAAELRPLNEANFRRDTSLEKPSANISFVFCAKLAASSLGCEEQLRVWASNAQPCNPKCRNWASPAWITKVDRVPICRHVMPNTGRSTSPPPCSLCYFSNIPKCRPGKERARILYMLRITVEEEHGWATINLEGTLCGPWVEEVRRCWWETLACPEQVIVELESVTSMDDMGRGLLAEMHRAGTRLRGRGLMTNYILEQIQGSSRDNRERSL